MRLENEARRFPWKLIFGVMAAFLCGVILAQVIGLPMDKRILDLRIDNAVNGKTLVLPSEAGGKDNRDLEAASGKNLFGLDGGPAGPGKGTSTPSGAELVGTFPPMGALFRVNGSSQAVLVGQKLGTETLKRVEGTRAILSDGSRTRSLDVLYAGVGGASPATVPSSPAPERREPREAPGPRRGITNPAGGQEGTIERELINKLLMDPYQELNRVRLRPKLAEDGSAQGIEAQWLHRDSLLSAMGIKSGDVIHSLNNIPIRTTSDIVNAMNSLLNSDRFVVDFLRDGAESQVAYSVK